MIRHELRRHLREVHGLDLSGLTFSILVKIHLDDHLAIGDPGHEEHTNGL